MSTAEKVAEGLFVELLGKRIERYREPLASGDQNKSILVYRKAMKAFQRLSLEDQIALTNFFKVVTIDTASIVLGGFGGISDLEGLNDQFFVTYGGESIEEEIQDAFLAKVEESGILG
ncbi:MAG: hypothetical protein Q7T36_01200 [Fluviicoccus sp.]|uniref:hypothetical protein n=1 Tax=Fluviicoccus sp. TaxID=2003552 RepID=UPI00271574C8|nr:hypothetical protein [Fluviicoccus sp.]MDO8329070.1 hypothetical protein [Fluviicoccus sp.]